jgi:hypothetical protein
MPKILVPAVDRLPDRISARNAEVSFGVLPSRTSVRASLTRNRKDPGRNDYAARSIFGIRGFMSKYRLVDAGTGMILRHYVRTLREAERERIWYEEETGREIRIMKVFETSQPGPPCNRI